MPTITEATKGNEADHGNHFWDLKLSDGREAWGLFKHDLDVGEEVVVAYEKNGKLRVKRPDKDDSQPRSNASSGQQGDWDPYHPRQRLIVRQSAIKAAVEVAPLSAAPTGHLQSGSDMTMALDQWIDYFEHKTWEAVSGEGDRHEHRQESQLAQAVDSERSNGGDSSPSPDTDTATNVDVLQAKTKNGVSPEVFAEIVKMVGATSLQDASPEQKAEMIAAMESA